MEKLQWNLLLKRFGAYIIDIVIVLLLSSIINIIPIFNLKENNTKYQNKYQEYEQNILEYQTLIQTLNNISENSQVTEELLESISNENYQEILNPIKEKDILSKEDITSLKDNITTKYQNTQNNLNYELNKLSITSKIVTTIILFLYFVIFQYFMKGQTIGKKINGLKVISTNNKLKFSNILIRSLIINNILSNIITILTILIFNINIYYQILNILDIIVMLIEAITVYLVLSKGRGLHDIIASSKVIIEE